MGTGGPTARWCSHGPEACRDIDDTLEGPMNRPLLGPGRGSGWLPVVLTRLWQRLARDPRDPPDVPGRARALGQWALGGPVPGLPQPADQRGTLYWRVSFRLARGRWRFIRIGGLAQQTPAMGIPGCAETSLQAVEGNARCAGVHGTSGLSGKWRRRKMRESEHSLSNNEWDQN